MTPAVFVHGMLADRRAWRDVTPSLGQRPCTFFELPGHGDAQDWQGGDYQTESLERLETLCDAPLHLIGHSFGATVALRFAVERPERLASLTLIEPVFFYAAKQSSEQEFEAYLDRAGPIATAIADQDHLTAAERFLAAWGVPGSWDLIPEPMKQAIASKMPLIEATAPSLLEDTGRIWPRLGRITCPVMLVTGSESEPVMASIQSGLAAQFDHLKPHQIDGAGHMIPVTHGRELGERIANFFS